MARIDRMTAIALGGARATGVERLPLGDVGLAGLLIVLIELET